MRAIDPKILIGILRKIDRTLKSRPGGFLNILRNQALKMILFAPSAYGAWRSFGKRKVFCIGLNKTGTTSMARAFRELGLSVGDQSKAERVSLDWGRRDFRRIFRYCRTAQAFQDVPFSWPFTFQALDQKFPGSKFVLTVRDSPEQWYSSTINFYAALMGKNGIPTAEDMREFPYVFKGYVYKVNRMVLTSPEDDPLHKETLISHYQSHLNSVQAYFRHRPGDLLVLNVAAPGAYDALCDFLGKPRAGRPFPWENATEKVEWR